MGIEVVSEFEFLAACAEGFSPDHIAISGDSAGGGLTVATLLSIRNAGLMDTDYDVYVVHDPQPLAIRHYTKHVGSRWIWRCHIDTVEHSPDVWAFLDWQLRD